MGETTLQSQAKQTSTERVRRHRQNRRSGTRFIKLAIEQNVLRALVKSRWLEHLDEPDISIVTRAVDGMIDEWARKQLD